MMRLLKWLIGAAISAAIMIGALAAYYWWYEPWGYNVRGVDVARYQTTITWPSLARDDVAFAYIKATEGGDWTDPLFARNWAKAKAADVPRGAYHFYTLCRPVEDQIAHIIATVPKEPSILPIAIDLEFGGNCKGRPPVPQFRADLTKMLDALEVHYGQRPILYLTRDFDDAYMAGAFNDEQYWLRSIIRQPSSDWRPWLFWQYHNKGRRDGVIGPIDLNAFDGGEDEWEAYVDGLPK